MAEHEQNGDTTEVPETAEIRILFNPTKQTVDIKFDPQEYKSWDMILAVIKMAQYLGELNRNMRISEHLQQAAAAQQAAIINEHQARKQIFRGK